MATLSSIDEVIDDLKSGKMVIVVDDESRENEGDLIIPAENADDQAINFMAKYARGLICLALEKKRVEALQLPRMAPHHNGSRFETAFTVSIEAREGVTTGISAADRARTIKVAIDPKKNASDIVMPGHVFPLEAREGGVLVRAGHTEAAVDLARMAGCQPAGVICEIMNDDGTMARVPDLIEFAKTHELKITSIADLISYRRKNEKLVACVSRGKMQSHYAGETEVYVYANQVEYAEHVVLVKGKIDPEQPVWVRMHALNILDDVLGDTHAKKEQELHKAMKMIDANGSGVVVLIREPNKNYVSKMITERKEQQKTSSLRDYGIGAQILLDLGVRQMILLSNSNPSIVGLEGYGLSVKEIKNIT